MDLLVSVDVVSHELRLSNKFDTVSLRLSIKLIKEIVVGIVLLPNI